jgi:heme/copper-type cytochrome/quinol oxidase subunit 2
LIWLSLSTLIARLTKRPSFARNKRRAVQAVAIAVVVLIVLVALGGVYYFVVYNKPATVGNFSERIKIDIGGYYYNTTDPTNNIPGAFYPENFNVSQGAHITLFITNTDNMTHGLAVPKFGVDTGPMKGNATTTISFVATPTGNYTYVEPSSDCGGGNCDANDTFVGWFLVQP